MQVHEAARAAGKATGILATVEADARRYLDMGMSFVAVGSDLGLLAHALSRRCATSTAIRAARRSLPNY